MKYIFVTERGKSCSSTACWGKNYCCLKGASKIPSKSIISHPKRYIFGWKNNFCHRIRYIKFFLNFWSKKSSKWAIDRSSLVLLKGIYGSWLKFYIVWRCQFCTQDTNIEPFLLKIGPELDNKPAKSWKKLYILRYLDSTLCTAILTHLKAIWGW